MARPILYRKVCHPPKMLGFNPFGSNSTAKEAISLQFDEYESFILTNYENFSQEVAAEKMNVSRPTFTRIYNCSLKKIAKAFAESKPIAIKGGNVEFDKKWYKCKKCFKLIEGLENHKKCRNCNTFCKSELELITNISSKINGLY